MPDQSTDDDRRTGGCACGSIRHEFTAKPDNPCICHCRMCQKQVGNVFGAFAGSHRANFRVTRGVPARFKSSDDGFRGFCRDCGTPLACESIFLPRVSVTFGSLDRHSEMKPQSSCGAEGMEPWLRDILEIPAIITGTGDTPARHDPIRQSNHQHPDHDPAQWPLMPQP